MENLCSLRNNTTVLSVYAPAKINLVLEVLGKDDDYHRVASIVQSIDLCDVLNFELDKEISFECDEPGLKRNNLVTRAVALLKENTGCGLGARILLRKRIPWGVGLGGGSSDAAATLLALNELWGLRLSVYRLLSLASKLGSDVPFFIRKGTALVEGRGERVTPLPSLRPIWFVLLVPPSPKVVGKTKQMYGSLRVADFTEGGFVRQAVTVLRRGKTIDHSLVFNVFERAALEFFPGLDRYRQILQEAAAAPVHLAGSGPCLFTFFSGAEEAGRVFSCLKRRKLECYLAISGQAGK